MPKVYNLRTDVVPKDAVYVGRPTIYGNPFDTGTRDEKIFKHRQYLLRNPDLMEKIKLDLVGKDLVCWCSPKKCHADFLLHIANDEF